MRYYRVKKEYDTRPVTSKRCLVKNELLTEHEMEVYCVPKKCVTSVIVKKNDTYFSFGARFCVQVGYDD